MPKADKTPRIFADTLVRLANSTKNEGHTSFSKISDSATEKNINHFIDGLGWQDESRAFIRITYGNNKTYHHVEIINQNNKPPKRFIKNSAFNVDALITNLSNIVLLLPTADCYPITIFDPKHKVVALNHLGWHSTAAHLLEKTIAKMNEKFDSDTGDLLVHIGPGIPARYYLFNEPAQIKMPGWSEHIHSTDKGHEIDLLSYNLEQLSLIGVNGQNIEVDPRNTVESDEFESHHVHAKQGKPVARRFLTAVMLR